MASTLKPSFGMTTLRTTKLAIQAPINTRKMIRRIPPCSLSTGIDKASEDKAWVGESFSTGCAFTVFILFLSATAAPGILRADHAWRLDRAFRDVCLIP